MATMQLNAEMYRALGVIAEDEGLMEKALRYVKKLAVKKEAPTLMSRQELLTKIEQAEEDFRQGRTYAMLPGESFVDFRRRIGR